MTDVIERLRLILGRDITVLQDVERVRAAGGVIEECSGDEEDNLQHTIGNYESFGALAASRGLGMELGPVSPGLATVTMVVRPDMVNGHGTCHGGYLFLLADTAFAFGSGGVLPPAADPLVAV